MLLTRRQPCCLPRSRRSFSRSLLLLRSPSPFVSPTLLRLSAASPPPLTVGRLPRPAKYQPMDTTGAVGSEKKLHTLLRLWEFPDQYVFEPADGVADSYLAVSRIDGNLQLIGELPQAGSNQTIKTSLVFGMVGMLRLIAGAYLLVISKREHVGSYMGYAVFKITSLKILPCNENLKSSSADQKLESEFSVLLSAAEQTSGLYFSYDVNLMLCAQKLYELGNDSKVLPLWRQADTRFMWNHYMLEPLVESSLQPYILPVIQGSYQNFEANIGKNKVKVTLIARRCTRRTGTRMWRRGADADGYVANFVESEQILQANGYLSSFVQVRGSIPFLWEQVVDLTYKPRFEIVRASEAASVVERHFLDLNRKYGAVLAVDLVNKHGSEGRLSQKFADSMQNIVGDNIRFVQFDFHQICGHVHFERLSLLYDQIENYLQKHGYFMLTDKGEKAKSQLGVVRTNCIDCLDRTNVTQSMIGRKVLESQLRMLGIFNADDTVSSFPDFDTSFKILWANHGDEISIQYSGTPALKGDFVRHGKRTTQGILKDGWNALARYYFNNFSDGTKQDAIDLLQGHYIVSVNRDINFASPQTTRGLEAYASIRLAFMLVFLGAMLTIISLRQARHDLRHVVFAFISAGLSIGITAFVRAKGRMFTNRPRLHRSRH